MISNHQYSRQDWLNYYHDQLDENLRLEMTLHLSSCDECLAYYGECAEANIFVAPPEIKENVMERVKKPIDTRRVMLTYVLAASIALGFYSFGLIDKTLDFAPRTIEESTKVAGAAVDNFSQIITNFVWRD